MSNPSNSALNSIIESLVSTGIGKVIPPPNFWEESNPRSKEQFQSEVEEILSNHDDGLIISWITKDMYQNTSRTTPFIRVPDSGMICSSGMKTCLVSTLKEGTWLNTFCLTSDMYSGPIEYMSPEEYARYALPEDTY